VRGDEPNVLCFTVTPVQCSPRAWG